MRQRYRDPRAIALSSRNSAWQARDLRVIGDVHDIADRAVPGFARPAQPPRAAVPTRRAGHHRRLRRVVRGRGLVRRRGLRARQGRVVRRLPGPARGHAFARHLRPGLRAAGPRGLRALLPRVDGGAGRALGHGVGGRARRCGGASIGPRAGPPSTWSACGRASTAWSSGSRRRTRRATRSRPSPRCSSCWTSRG